MREQFGRLGEDPAKWTDWTEVGASLRRGTQFHEDIENVGRHAESKIEVSQHCLLPPLWDSTNSYNYYQTPSAYEPFQKDPLYGCASNHSFSGSLNYKPLPLINFDSAEILREPRLDFDRRTEKKSESVDKKQLSSGVQWKYTRKQSSKNSQKEAKEQRSITLTDLGPHQPSALSTLQHSSSDSLLNPLQNFSALYDLQGRTNNISAPLTFGNATIDERTPKSCAKLSFKDLSVSKHAVKVEDDTRSQASSTRSRKILFTRTNSVKLFKKKPGNASHGSELCIESPPQSPVSMNASFMEPAKKRSSFYVKQTQPKLEDFRRGKLMGKGNFGHVYVAEHIETGFICAMKIVPKQKIQEDKIEQQMVRELKLHSILKHRNIVQQYGFFADSQNLYIMVELCPDGQLYNVIKRKKRLSEPTTAFLIRQLCEGLLYLHDNHIIHRDIKPENIILTNGIVKICDFGWAVNCATGLRDTRCGTPLYLSPEMVKGQQYDDSVDIWAVGVLTYELLIGSMPFKIWWEGELNKIVRFAVKQVSEEVRFPTYVDLTSTAKDFILRILEKDPTNRLEVEALLHHAFLKQAHESPEYFAELA